MCGAIVYGYRCSIDDIVILPVVHVNGCRVPTEDMPPQEYCEYTKWFDYCNFANNYEDSDFVIGIWISYDKEVVGIDDMRQAMNSSSDILDAVCGLTGKTISVDDLGFCCMAVDW